MSNIQNNEQNKELVEMLKTITRVRLCEGTTDGKWSAQQHSNAAKIISNFNYKITDINQVKNIPKIGDKIITKIEEFLLTGKLLELEQNNKLIEKSDIIGKFMCIPGVGFSTAQKWYDLGYHSREDLINGVKSNIIKLNRIQTIGLKYLDEISQKMNRDQMKDVGEYIRKCLKSIEPNFDLIIVGSYRRGISSSKDVDIVIYPNSLQESENIDGVSGVLEDLLKTMKEHIIIFQENDRYFMGLIEQDLEKDYEKTHEKTHEKILRRVDIWICPLSELITTLVGRTAYVETNKKLRIEANKKGYKLSNHGIYKRDGMKRITVNSEDDVFKMFNVEKDYVSNFSIQ